MANEIHGLVMPAPVGTWIAWKKHMDIPRPELRRKRRTQQIVIGGAGLLAAIVVTLGVSRLEPAAPSVSRGSVWVDTVREGEMRREVRGPGRLAPREIRWIAAQSAGRVDRVVVLPGAVVESGTVLIQMSNPDLMQQTEEAKFGLAAAEADLAETELRLKSQQLDQRAALGIARAEYEGAKLQAEAEEELADEGIVPSIQYRRSALLAEQLKLRTDIEAERLSQFSASMEAQLAGQRARVDQARNSYQRRLDQVDALQVRAALAGVLQEVLVEEGQQVEIGVNTARVARPDDLQAELRIPETQARDVQVGQHVDVDTRNGVVEGRVKRIDPAVQAGTVQVDVELLGPLPRGARPDLSVDGTIELERIERALYTGRPAYGQPNTTIGMFKLLDDGKYAIRVPVEVGRTSVNEIEILKGLAPGDSVILSDTSAWEEYDRIQLD
jgi:HlyD family secretion protein